MKNVTERFYENYCHENSSKTINKHNVNTIRKYNVGAIRVMTYLQMFWEDVECP